jgi:tRNA(Ile)-lysidine synthetase-like protein
MPIIGRLAPGGVRALARLAALARDDEDFLQRAAIEAGRSLVLSQEAGGASQPTSTLRVDCRTLAALPPALGRRVVREVLQRAAPGAGFTVRHIEAVRELASADKSNGHLDLPGLAVERRGRSMSIAPRLEANDANPRGRPRRLTGRGSIQRALDVPGAVDMPEAGVRIAASLKAGEPTAARDLDRHVAMLQASSLTLPLAVRTRRPGDRIRPLGAPGRRKLQDLLVDRKVPREAREIVPLVVDAADRIVWVVGVAIAEECRVTSPGAGVVILEVRDLRN